MQEYKIDVRNLTEQQKKDVQDAFFRLGYRWYGGSDRYTWLSAECYYAGKDMLITADGTSPYLTWIIYFNEHPNKEITYKELMTLAYGDNIMNTQKEFTKASLKDGMFVRLKNGNIYIHTKGNLLNHAGWMTLESYNVDLKHTSDDWSIVEAMELKHNSNKLGYGFSKIEHFEYNSIWSRSEQTQQQKQLAELKTAQEELLLKAQEINDKISALQQGN